MQHSDITFKPNDKIVRVHSAIGECEVGTKCYVNSASGNGKYIEVRSIVDGFRLNTGSTLLQAKNFKLVMTCKPEPKKEQDFTTIEKGDRIICVNGDRRMPKGVKCTVKTVDDDGTEWITVNESVEDTLYTVGNFKRLVRCNVGDQ